MARYDYPKYEEQQPDPEKPYEESAWYIPPYQYTPPQWTPPVEQRREEQNPPSYFYQEPAYQEVQLGISDPQPSIDYGAINDYQFDKGANESVDKFWRGLTGQPNPYVKTGARQGEWRPPYGDAKTLGGVSDPRDAIGYGGVPQYRGNTPARDYQASQAWSDYNYNPPSGFDYGLPTYSPSPTQPKYYEATGRDSQAWSDYNYNPPESVWSQKPSNYQLPRDKVLDPRDAPGYVGPTKYGGGAAVNVTQGGSGFAPTRQASTPPPRTPTNSPRYPSYGGGGYGGGYTGGARVSNGGVEPEGKWYEGLVNWRF